MSRAWFVALGAGAIAFAIAFAYPAFASEPVAWYYPLERAWSFEVRPHALAMDFYGRVAQAMVAWLAVTAPVYLLVRRRSVSARVIGLVAAWLLTVIAFVMLFYAWTLHYRVL